MGYFSDVTTTYVSSTVYNLAGDVDLRPNFLKATVLQAVVLEKDSIAEAITDAYLTGPGVKLQGFTNWANNNGFTDELGLASESVVAVSAINYTTLPSHVPVPVGSIASINSAIINSGDYTYWTDQYVALNHPELISSVYSSVINNAGDLITISYGSHVTNTETFVPANFQAGSRYLYVNYNETIDMVPGPIVTGTETILGPDGVFSSTVGYTNTATVVTTHEYDILTGVTTHISYSDGSSPTTETYSATYTDGTFDETFNTWEKTVHMGVLPGTDLLYSIKYIMQQDLRIHSIVNKTVDVTVENIAGGATKTTTVTTTVHTKEGINKVERTDTQQNTMKYWGSPQIYIYKYGSGNAALDAMFATVYTGPQYLPIIPIRVNNQFISDTSPTVLYPLAKKAMKRAIGANFDDIEASIADNASLGDIDYAYAMFGVSLNTKENSCRKYIYKFFKNMSDNPDRAGALTNAEYFVNLQATHDSIDAWWSWYNSQGSIPVEPDVLPHPIRTPITVKIASAATHINYNIDIEWLAIRETVGTGLITPTAKAGQVWIDIASVTNYDITYIIKLDTAGYDLHSVTKSVSSITINYQITDNSWSKLVIDGLEHRNYIYGAQFVRITAVEALQDPLESGFIIPLNEDLYKSMGMIDKTQMATASCFLVFNSYQAVTQEWYQRGAFKFLLLMVAIVISVTFPPVGAAAKSAAIATGTALGLSGTTALITGFIVNYLAAIVITKLVMDGSTHVFGDKIGTVIGTIIAIVTLQVAQGLIGGQSAAVTFNNMMQAPNLLKLTIAVGNSYANYINESSKDILKQTEQLMQDAQSKSKEIAEKYEEMFGNSDMAFIFDPKLLAERNAVLGESMDSFLERTLMTGSDIVDISLNMLHDFADITLSLDLKT